MKPYTVTLVAIIAACLVMICYLLLYVPYECGSLTLRSGGNATCGLEPGAYIIAAVSGVVAVIAVALIIRAGERDRGA